MLIVSLSLNDLTYAVAQTVTTHFSTTDTALTQAITESLMEQAMKTGALTFNHADEKKFFEYLRKGVL